ncbi:MAG: hypothetical protein Q4F49_08435, partial [Pseudoxanthomonas suwonensis]|nr:hypothetical protein [Pseudoxanthomonas suwonensis]
MKQGILIAVLAVLAMAVLGRCVADGGVHHGLADDGSGGTARQPGSAQAGLLGARPAPARSREYIAHDLHPEPGCTFEWIDAATLTTRDPAFIAFDAREAEWLALRGYPTSAQVRLAEAGSLDSRRLLDRLTTDQDAFAGVLLGLMEKQQGQFTEARASFGASARRGSLYGFIAMSVADLEQEGEEPADEPKMVLVASMLAAEQLGDHQASYYTNKHAGDLNMAFWAPSIEANAVSLAEHLRDNDTRRLRRAPTYPPRPNAEKWGSSPKSGERCPDLEEEVV